ncbi:MAG: ferrous iron transport protein B, partial [bacterium]
LETSINLAIEALELGRNIIIDLNMVDILSARGITLDTMKLSQLLGVEIVETVGFKNIGLDRLKKAIVENAGKQRRSSFKVFYGDELEYELNEIENLISNKQIDENFNSRWLAIKMLEGSSDFIMMLSNYPELNVTIENKRKRLERRYKSDIASLIIERRYAFTNGLVRECKKKTIDFQRKIELTDKIDKIVTNKFIGLPLLLLTMFLGFEFVFITSDPLIKVIELVFEKLGVILTNFVEYLGGSGIIISLINDALLNGVGTVIKFVPNIFSLFLLITVLEDSGYMARIAFVADSFMHRIGLHSKSIIPMVMGFGCNVPAIMGCRVLGSAKDRILTILIIPLMSCSARLPIYTLFSSIFFPKHKAAVILSLYILGAVLAVIMASIFKRIFFTKETEPLIMELPVYKLPQPGFVLSYSWYRTALFLKRAGSIIFLGVVVAWALASLPPGVEYASQSSFLGKIGGTIAPIFSKSG